MENQRTSAGGSLLRSLFTPIVIVACLIIGYCVFKFVLGHPSHFEGGSTANHPKKGDFYGIVYKGGPIVFILIAISMLLLPKK